MEGFEQLQKMYRQVLPEKRAALEHEWRHLLAGAEPEPHVLELRRQLHQLSGSGGAYGYDAMGEMARSLEKRWVQWLAQPAAQRAPAEGLCGELAPLIRTLLEALQEASLRPDGGDE